MISWVIWVLDENIWYVVVYFDSYEIGYVELDIGRWDVVDDCVVNDGDEKSEEYDDILEFEMVWGKSYGDCDWCGYGVGNYGL